MVKRELRLRLMSSVVIVAIVLAAMSFEWAFCIFLLVIAIGMTMEWYNMTKGKDLAVGSFICLTSAISLGLLRSLGLPYTATYFACLWSVDSCAFLGGKLFGGPKLLPKISPKKTWSGLISAAAGCFVAILICRRHASFLEGKTWIVILPFALIFTILAQAGDLLVSKYKRTYGVKDTGEIIPGHGGLLDRFDGATFTSPAFLLVSLFLT